MFRRVTSLEFILVRLLILPLAFSSLTACSRDAAEAAPDRPGGVVVTIYPLYDLARRVAGEEIDITLLMPPGQSPHTYSPTPADTAAIKNARLLITAGGGVDRWVESIAERERAKGLEIFTLIELVGEDPEDADDEHDTPGFVDEEDHDHDDGAHEHEEDADHDDDDKVDDDGPAHAGEPDEHGHYHGAVNPHQWLVPRVAARFAGTLSERLQNLYPDEAEDIRNRTMDLGMELAELAIDYEDRLAPFDDRRIITFHDAFNPLADEYDLEVAATLYTFESVDVTPAAIDRAAKQIRDLGVAAVFIEPQMNPSAVNRLGELVTLRTLDPIGDPDREGYGGYIPLMRSNLMALVEGLSENRGNREVGTGGGGADDGG